METRENRAFLEMLAAAKARLEGRRPEEIAEKAQVDFDRENRRFSLCSLGQELVISYPDYVFKTPVDQWQHLVVLHYLDLADGTPLTKELCSFSQLRDGMVRGGGFDRTCEQTMARYFAKKPLENLEAVCRALGAVPQDSNADLCAVLPFLPRCPVIWKLWLEEEGLDGSGRLFLDSSANHYLTIEDAVTVGELMLARLRQEYERRFPPQ